VVALGLGDGPWIARGIRIARRGDAPPGLWQLLQHRRAVAVDLRDEGTGRPAIDGRDLAQPLGLREVTVETVEASVLRVDDDDGADLVVQCPGDALAANRSAVEAEAVPGGGNGGHHDDREYTGPDASRCRFVTHCPGLPIELRERSDLPQCQTEMTSAFRSD